MLERKFAENLEKFLLHEPLKILLVNGARQIGKSYLIRYVGKKLFKHFVEINLKADQEGDGIFKTVRSKEDFYLQLGAMAGNNLGSKDDTLVFLDEIQSYPHLMTMLKFLNEDGKYRYVASGSQLGSPCRKPLLCPSAVSLSNRCILLISRNSCGRWGVERRR